MRRAATDVVAVRPISASTNRRHRGPGSSPPIAALILLFVLLVCCVAWRRVHAPTATTPASSPSAASDTRDQFAHTRRLEGLQVRVLQPLIIVVLPSQTGNDNAQTRARGAEVLSLALMTRQHRPSTLTLSARPTFMYLERSENNGELLQGWHRGISHVAQGVITTPGGVPAMTVWIPEELLIDLGLLSPIGATSATSSFALEDTVGWIFQALQFGRGFTAAQWLMPAEIGRESVASNHAWSIVLDGLRVVRRKGRDGSEEISVMPRFHGFPYGYEAHAEGGFVSPLFAETNFLEGSLRELNYQLGVNNHSDFSRTRTIDMPHGGCGWSAPLDVVLNGIAALKSQDTAPVDIAHSHVLATMIVASSMMQCRRGATNNASPSTGCTLFLSHRIRVNASVSTTSMIMSVATEIREQARKRCNSHTSPLHGALWRALEKRWQGSKAAIPVEELLAHHTTLYWDPFCSCTGINIEAANFALALETQLPVQAVASSDCWCKGFPPSDATSLQRLRDESARGQAMSIWVSHKPVSFYPTFPYHGALSFTQRPDYVIGRCMTEGDRFSAEDVKILNDDRRVDELWVPAPFLVDVLRHSGVKPSRRIVVVPEPIDASYYDAALHRAATAEVYRLDPSRRPFRFLSNFKWEPRKGWDVLLWAYFTTFTARDAVELVLKTYLYMDPMPRDIARIRGRIVGFVRTMLKEKQAEQKIAVDTNTIDWQWVTVNLPKVSIVADEIDAAAMPAFYAAHDVFVLPSRGEGWGLPLQEAMSVGLPCITTEWSGMLGFVNHDNAFLIRVVGTEPSVDSALLFERQHVPTLIRGWERGNHANTTSGRACHRVFNGDDQESRDLRFLRTRIDGIALDGTDQGNKLEALLRCSNGDLANGGPPHWAVLDARHLAKLLRQTFDDRGVASSVGVRGRVTIATQFTREAVADVVTKRLLAIVKEIGDAKL